MKMRTAAELILIVVLTSTLALTGCALNQSKEPAAPADTSAKAPGAIVGEVRAVTATVDAIDYETRHVVLKTPDGTLAPLKVSEEAYNFDQVKKGDLVDISFTKAIALKLEKDTGAEPGVSTSSRIERAPKGQKPKGTAYNVIDIRAKVVAVDAKTREIKLSLPDGTVYPVIADDSVKRFEEIKVGDIVLASYTEAMAISVRPAGQPEKK
ncbi:MAG: hypothetical protein AB1724_08790 [Thermodesulfobacteriota bacterium]